MPSRRRPTSWEQIGMRVYQSRWGGRPSLPVRNRTGGKKGGPLEIRKIVRKPLKVSGRPVDPQTGVLRVRPPRVRPRGSDPGGSSGADPERHRLLGPVGPDERPEDGLDRFADPDGRRVD